MPAPFRSRLQGSLPFVLVVLGGVLLAVAAPAASYVVTVSRFPVTTFTTLPTFFPGSPGCSGSTCIRSHVP